MGKSLVLQWVWIPDLQLLISLLCALSALTSEWVETLSAMHLAGNCYRINTSRLFAGV